MKRIGICLSKGGVGKTTTAVNLAYGLAWRGKKVLLIDVDTQGQCSYALGIDSRNGLYDFMENGAPFQKVIVEARRNLWLLSGGDKTAQIKRVIARGDMNPQLILANALKSYDKKFDFLILDTAPGWDSLSVNVLFYVREVICPVSLEAMSIEGFRSFIDLIESAKEHGAQTKLKFILPTFLDGRVSQSTELLTQLKKYFGKLVCDPIRYNVSLSEASGKGQTIYEYDPRSRGAQDYALLIRRIYEEKER